jgi:L-ascorbate metabolism protein UlaG (beta-lactamase superfamily)
VIYEGLLETLSAWRLDVAFALINGRDYFRTKIRTKRGILGNTDFRGAAELAEALGITVIIPTHYDLFKANGEDPGNFASYRYRLNPMRRHKLLRPGEAHYFVRKAT